jgi:hypothetical protein
MLVNFASTFFGGVGKVSCTTYTTTNARHTFDKVTVKQAFVEF